MKVLGSGGSIRGGAVFTMLLLCVASFAAVAQGPAKDFNVPAQPATTGIPEFARQAGIQILVSESLVRGKRISSVTGTHPIAEALAILLKGTGLVATSEDGVTYTVAARTSVVTDSTDLETSSKPADQQNLRTVEVAQATQTPAESAVVASEESLKEQKKDELSEIVVTGTHIRGVQDIGAPTLTISRAEIDRTGYQTMEQLVATLPQNFNGLTMGGAYVSQNSPLASANNDNSTAIDLRGLGPQSTLTLVNGQRVAGSIQGRATDISMIPLSMVDHVDIVTGGASAIYGADAVGGVANIVLRQSYDGADTQASFGGTEFGGDRLQLSQVIGRDYDRFGFILGYEFARQDEFDVVRAHLTLPPSPGGTDQISAPVEPDAHKHSVYLSGHFDPSDWIQLYGDASYVHKAQDQYALTSYPASDPANDFAGASSLTQTNQEYGVTAGARVKLPSSWRLDVTGSTSTYEQHSNELNTAIFGGISSTSPLSVNTRSSLNSASAIADGNFLSAFGIQSKAAVGVDYRREFLSNNDSPLSFEGQGEIPHISRDVTAVFGELNVPVVTDGMVPALRKLELSLSARDDHYSDFGNAFDPQAGIVWQPVDTLSIRAEYAKAFRAPDLFTLHSGSFTDLGPFSLATPQNPVPAAVPTLLATGGNPAIGPERAKTWSSGFDYQIPFTSPARLSVSYFDIRYDDRINNPLSGSSLINSALYPGSILNLHPTPAQVLAFAGQGPFAGNFGGYPWNGDFQTILTQIPNLILFDDRSLNISEERLRGMDFSLDTKQPTPIGEALFGFNGTRTFTHYQQITTQSPTADIYNMVGYPLGFRVRGEGGLTHGPLSAFLFVNYQGGYTNQYEAPSGRIASWTTFDGTLRFDDSKLLPRGPLGNVIVSASVQNMFDRNPPLFTGGVSGFMFDPANANPFGRFISVSVEKRW
jgi:iron complex outermembrane receptor protein